MAEPRHLPRLGLWRGLALIPWVMLAVTALCWLRHGVDLPFVDDWRAYADGSAGRFAPRQWFQAANSTIAPVGLALDALAQRLLGGNAIAYQFITLLLVQGGVLAAQWRLLRWALGDVRPAALAFVGTVFMVQPGSYWGEQNMAYHQALPLLGLMGALCLLTVTGRPGRLAAAAALLAAVAGLSYVSGAVAGVVLGVALLIAGAVFGRPVTALTSQLRAVGLGVLAGGGVTLAVQAWAVQRAPAALGANIPTTWPDQPAFWAYAIGKLGRTLGQPGAQAGWDLLLVALAWLAAAAVLVALAVQACRATAPEVPREDGGHAAVPVLRRVALIAGPLVAMLAVYLAMVAYGRAGFHDASVRTWLEHYRFGHLRFHHHWLTLLWPWVLAALAALCRPRGALAAPATAAVLRTWVAPALALGLLLVLGASRGVFDVNGFFRSAGAFRATQWACLQSQWGTGEPIRCPITDLPDATGALLQARELGASFTRYLPVTAATAAGRPLWRWHEIEASQPGQWQGAQPHAGPHGTWWRTGDDAQWLLAWSQDAELARALAGCQVLDVAVTLQASREGQLQVFFVPAGDGTADGFREDRSQLVRYALPPGQVGEADLPLSSARVFALQAPAAPPEAAPAQTLHLAWESRSGFAPRLRIDPADRPMWVRVTAVELACRLPTLAAWRAAQAKEPSP